jgi:hypothetical protein
MDFRKRIRMNDVRAACGSIDDDESELSDGRDLSDVQTMMSCFLPRAVSPPILRMNESIISDRLLLPFGI